MWNAEILNICMVILSCGSIVTLLNKRGKLAKTFKWHKRYNQNTSRLINMSKNDVLRGFTLSKSKLIEEMVIVLQK